MKTFLNKKFWKLPLWSIFLIATVVSAATVLIWQYTWQITVRPPPLEITVLEDFPEEMVINITQRAVINITNPLGEGIYTSLTITISGDQPLSNDNVTLTWICYGSDGSVIWNYTIGRLGDKKFEETEDGKLVWTLSPVLFGPYVKTIHELYVTFHLEGNFKITMDVQQYT